MEKRKKIKEKGSEKLVKKFRLRHTLRGRELNSKIFWGERNQTFVRIYTPLYHKRDILAKNHSNNH